MKSLNYKDTDKIYTLYSKNKGKISAKANGIRKISSRRAGNMDTLNHVTVAISESPSGFKTISEVKGLNSFKNLKGSLDKSAKGYYLSELVHKFSEEGHENNEIFNLFLASLENLNNSLDSYAVVLQFEILLLKSSGYEMYLDQCAYCRKPFSLDWNSPKFNYSLGGLICGTCSGTGFTITKDTALVLNSLSSKSFIPANIQAHEAFELIKPYVEDILDSKLKTSDIYKDQV